MADADENPEKPAVELEGGRMPFLMHLVELRDRLRNAAIAFVLAFLVSCAPATARPLPVCSNG